MKSSMASATYSGRCDFDVGQEAFGTDDRCQLGLEVVGQVDRRHTTLTQFTLDGVAAFEGCVQASDGIRHGHTPGSDQGQHPRAGR